MVHGRARGGIGHVHRQVGDEPGHPGVMRIVDVLRFVGHLVVVRVAAGGEEGDRDAITGILVVVAAAVDVRRMAVGVEGVVEHQAVPAALVHRLHHVAQLGRDAARTDDLDVVRVAVDLVAGQGLASDVRRVAAPDHVDVELGHDRFPRHGGVVGEPLRTEEALFLSHVPDEEHRPLRVLALGDEPLGDLQHRHRAGAVVVGAVVDRVRAGALAVGTAADLRQRGVDLSGLRVRELPDRRVIGALLAEEVVHDVDRVVRHRLPHPDVVVVPAHGDVLVLERRVGAAQDRHHVPRRELARHVVERHVARHLTPLGPGAERGEWPAHDRLCHRARDVQIGRKDRLVVEQDDRVLLLEAGHLVGRHVVACDDGDPGRAGVPLVDQPTVRDAGGVPRDGPREGQHDELAGRPVRREPAESVGKVATIDDRHAVDGACARTLVTGDEVTPSAPGGPADRDARGGVDRAVHHREGLEVGAVLAGRLEAEAAHLGGDVLDPHHVPLGAEETPTHRVIREAIEPGLEVGGGDGGVGGAWSEGAGAADVGPGTGSRRPVVLGGERNGC